MKTFALLYSDDGEKWEQYGSKGNEKVWHVLQEIIYYFGTNYSLLMS